MTSSLSALLASSPAFSLLGEKPAGRLRLDVLVVAKHVLRVVGALELDEARVVLPAVRGPDALVALVAQVVHVDALRRVRLHRVPERARPLDVRLLLGLA